MTDTTVYFSTCTEAIKFLNADLSNTTTAHDEAYANNSCGTYALINDIISNLSSIKASIKTNEKVISRAIQGEVEDGGQIDTTSHVISTDLNITVSNIRNNSHVTARGERNTTDQNVAILTNGNDKLSEAATFEVLRAVGVAVMRLKNGTYGTHGTITVEGTASDGTLKNALGSGNIDLTA
tara:strand:- start:24 stop:566 length:543 start_codon:yes stop_codon:yes gene_type:complete